MKLLLRSALLCAALALVAGAAPALAQRDTVPRPVRPAPADTVRDSTRVTIPGEAVRGDTIPGAKRDTAPPDSTHPAPAFPAHPAPPANGFSDGTWVYGPRQLQYFHGLSLADLLDRIPGLVVTRAGGFGRQMGVSPYASGGGRFRVFIDGYEYRSFSSATPDLQRIPLVNVQEVRIARELDEVRVDITSLRLADVRPFAQIEGMDGDLATRVLRGIFTRPIGRRWLGEVALDVDQSQGSRREQKSNVTSAIARLSYLFSSGWGLQAELRTTKLNLEDALAESPAVGSIESVDRTDAILRARGRLLGRIDLEGIVGRSRQSPAGGDSASQAVRNTQAEARLSMPVKIGMLSAGARVDQGSDSTWAPTEREVWGRLDFAPGRYLAASGEVRQLTLGGVNGLETSGTLRFGPFGGVSLFGQVAAGSRGVRFLADTTLALPTLAGTGGHGIQTLDTVNVLVFRTFGQSLNGLRAGVEMNRGAYHLGAALVHHDVDQTAPYGWWYDRVAGLRPGLAVNGVEAYGSVPLLVPGLTLSGWYERWFGTPDRTYLPAQLGRAALQYNRVFKQGNLEPTIRVEVIGRDATLTYDALQTGTQVQGQYALLNWYLQIRIIDIRIFWQYQNALNNQLPYDVPGTRIPGGRNLYGVRWFFRN